MPFGSEKSLFPIIKKRLKWTLLKYYLRSILHRLKIIDFLNKNYICNMNRPLLLKSYYIFKKKIVTK